MFRRAIDAARARDDREAEALSRLNLARALGRSGNVDAALGELDRAEDLYAALERKDGMARARAARAGAFYLKGDRDAARSEMLRAVAVAPAETETEILGIVSSFTEELSLDAIEDKEAAEWRRALLEGRAVGGGTGKAGGRGDTLMTLGAEAARQGRDQEASRYYADAARAYRDAGMDSSARAADEEAREHSRPGGVLVPTREERE
jgi:tetratricopeptide (TPR) repeat protein